MSKKQKNYYIQESDVWKGIHLNRIVTFQTIKMKHYKRNDNAKDNTGNDKRNDKARDNTVVILSAA